MINWIYLNTQKITRAGYNDETHVMYIDFVGSTIDTPYTGVTKEQFQQFSAAKDADEYFDKVLKQSCEQIRIDRHNSINLG